MSQNNKKRIDTLKIKFSYFDKSKDDLSRLEFMQRDGSDPLCADRFVREYISYYDENRISRA